MMAPRQVEGSADRARCDGRGSGSWNAVELTVSANSSLRPRCKERPQPVLTCPPVRARQCLLVAEVAQFRIARRLIAIRQKPPPALAPASQGTPPSPGDDLRVSPANVDRLLDL